MEQFISRTEKMKDGSIIMEDEKKMTREFFICMHCGNTKIFRVFTGNFQVVVQSPETGTRVDESGILPSLRKDDNFVECLSCQGRMDYEEASLIGRQYVSKHRKLLEKEAVF